MDAVFLKVLNMSLAACWLIAAVVVLRLLLKKAPKALHCILWAFVAIRLICPFSFESAFSLIPDAEPISQEILYSQIPQYETNQDETIEIERADSPVIAEHDTVQAVSDSETKVSIISIVSVVWVIGAAVLLLYAAASYFRVRLKVKTAVKLEGLVWQSEYIDAPFILGAIRPRIYIPYHINKEQLDHVLAHERAHIKRLDHWWKPLGFVLLAVYWFNPLVWVAYVLLCRDIELACDERVIRDLGVEEKKAYSDALLTFSVPRRMIAACPLAFGEVGVKGRIKSVLNYKKPAFWIILVALVACIAAAVCFLTNPIEEQPTSDDVLQQNGYRITEIITDQCVDVKIPIDVLSEDAWTEEGITFEPDEVILDQTNSTTLYLERVYNSMNQFYPNYLTFRLKLTHSVKESGTIRSGYQPIFANDRTHYYMGLTMEHQEVYDSGTTYENSVRYGGLSSAGTIIVEVKCDVVEQASDYIAFSLDGFTNVVYEKGKANREDDILISEHMVDTDASFAYEWINYYNDSDIVMRESKTLDIMELGKVFRWSPTKVEVIDDIKTDSTTVLYSGAPVWDVYLADLNGDGYRELCSTVSKNYDITNTYIAIYDFANQEYYEARQNNCSFTLSIYNPGEDGTCLKATRRNVSGDGKRAVGDLIISSDGVLRFANIEHESTTDSSDEPFNGAVDYSILNGNEPFHNQPLEITEDPMAYQERLDWVKSGTVYTETLENGGETSTISLGQWQEGYGCLAYVWQPYGSPHPGVCFLTIRFADGTQARLPLPDEQTYRTAKPMSMEFQNGKFVYDVQLDSEWPEDESIKKRVYHYELDLAFMTLSLSLGQMDTAASAATSSELVPTQYREAVEERQELTGAEDGASLSFTELAVGDEVNYTTPIVFEEDGWLKFDFGYTPAGVTLSVGLRRTDGFDMTGTGAGGHLDGTIGGIPAGTYVLFIRNDTKATEDTVHLPMYTAELGVMNFRCSGTTEEYHCNIRNALDRAITQSVYDHFTSGDPSGLLNATNHVLLDSEWQGNTVTAYVLAMHKTYRLDKNEVEPVSVGSEFTAAKLTFTVEDGVYTLSDYWEPRALLYKSDIRAQFSEFAAQEALDSSVYEVYLDSECDNAVNQL